MALRVLPSLSLVVTEDSVRKQKRIVMFVPGIVVFAIYRVAKLMGPLSDPIVLLALSGFVGAVTAWIAYGVGRSTGWKSILQADGWRLLVWLVGWIGVVYGVQLSLMVLALLWLVGYDYLQHPDGPAMMAMIISSTAVARDAFEIGHVRKIALMGRPFPTFPDGATFRVMVRDHVMALVPWVVVGCLVGAVGGVLGYFVEEYQRGVLVQLSAVAILGGGVGLCAFMAGRYSQGSWIQAVFQTKASELMKYWWWPGLAFTATYYLVVAGFIIFLLRHSGISPMYAMFAGGCVTGLMAAYCYYLGFRRQVEEQQGPTMSSALLRCPFVMGILGKPVAGILSVPVSSGGKI